MQIFDRQTSFLISKHQHTWATRNFTSPLKNLFNNKKEREFKTKKKKIDGKQTFQLQISKKGTIDNRLTVRLFVYSDHHFKLFSALGPRNRA